ncbi:MAG TPA: hypothetical protein VMS86_07850 [Thermoanaerobaculia bacterium]|nr:hypothetical protein [Thermoanaerobaculia bacterium]
MADHVPFSATQAVAGGVALLTAVALLRGYPLWRRWLAVATAAKERGTRLLGWFWVVAWPVLLLCLGLLLWALLIPP